MFPMAPLTPMTSLIPSQVKFRTVNSEHFMCVCVAYMTIRLRTFRKAITTMTDIATSSPGLITKFIKLTGRFDRDDLFG